MPEDPLHPGQPAPETPIPCAASIIPNLNGAGFEIVEQPAAPLTNSQIWGEEGLDSAE